MLSWAIVGGGWVCAHTVAWYYVDKEELHPPVDPKQFLSEQLDQASIRNAVGLLTSRRLDAYVDVEQTCNELSVRCIATVGLSNALRVGDPPDHVGPIGTINLLCQVSVSMSEQALVEGIALATEAKTAAMLESLVPSRLTALPATGTGTDCIVIAAPDSGNGAVYAGKHTAIGSLIGRTVREATRRGVDEWKREP